MDTLIQSTDRQRLAYQQPGPILTDVERKEGDCQGTGEKKAANKRCQLQIYFTGSCRDLKTGSVTNTKRKMHENCFQKEGL